MNLLDLDDDSLSYLLHHLPIEDHMNFAKVCQRFHRIWKDYKCWIYKRMELGSTSDKGFKQELILLHHTADHVKNLIVNLNRKFEWNKICMAKFLNMLKRMHTLERLILWLKDDEPYEVLETIIRTLEHLPNIKCIATYQDNEVVDILYQFDDYEDFLKESKMSRNPMIEPIYSHTKIRLLVLNNAPIKETLADLAQHSKRIKELSFRMTQNAEEYSPLAELPNLRVLQIFGHYGEDCPDLMPLVSALSAKLLHQLSSLTIHVPGLGYDETAEIIRIEGLQRLDCHFSELRCLELLKHLKVIAYLFIRVAHTENIDNLVLAIIENCPTLHVIQIDSPNLSRSIIPKALKVLQKLRNSKDQSPLRLMFGKNPVQLDADTREYLRVFW
ncbi:uncharacterized protein LOC132794379 isoform X1 [Drosophila nasuta]|uniref:uncharacterized protein LOC132794379 isoform X1 n=1 Tax=Drosophila nasuta TaxID=42062 RepID=UPI00295E4EB8|nr:uncharacterized protein LOC132794379 isoform X1 [Drosophila nasuta]